MTEALTPERVAEILDTLEDEGFRETAGNLRTHISALEKNLEDARRVRDAAMADNAALLAVLSAVEHVESRNPSEGMRYCPSCGECESGHAEGCALGHVLNDASHSGSALLERMGRLEEASTKAAAELRHAYGHLAHGQHINPDLVARAIRILETVTTKEGT